MSGFHHCHMRPLETRDRIPASEIPFAVAKIAESWIECKRHWEQRLKLYGMPTLILGLYFECR